MTPAAAKKFLQDQAIKYILAQFVDIHGAAKAKAVPVEHLDMVLGDGAGFAGFAVWGLGMGPHGPDYMGVGDLDTLAPMAWMPGFARMACDGHVHGKPYEYCSRVALKRQLDKLATRGLTFYTGIEPEFLLLSRKADGTHAPFDETDALDKPCYDYKGLARSATFLERLTAALRAVGIDVYQIDHEDANGQFEVNFTYADALRTADNYVFFKMAASEIARSLGMIATFMPKPFSNRTGTGAHFHLSIGDAKTRNLFHDKRDKQGLGLSRMAYHFLGGRSRPRARARGGGRPVDQLVQAAGRGACAVRRDVGARVHRLRRQQPHGMRAQFPAGGSSCGCRTARAILISPPPRSWRRGSTASTASSTRARRSTRTSTSGRRRSSRSGASSCSRRISPKRSTRSSRTR